VGEGGRVSRELVGLGEERWEERTCWEVNYKGVLWRFESIWLIRLGHDFFGLATGHTIERFRRFIV